MAQAIIREMPKPIDENTSDDIGFDVVDDAGNALDPTAVVVYIYVEGHFDIPVWVNGRDGSNIDGLALVGNVVDLHLSPADNTIIDLDLYAKTGYETHMVRFEVTYNGGVDRFYVHFKALIKDLSEVP